MEKKRTSKLNKKKMAAAFTAIAAVALLIAALLLFLGGKEEEHGENTVTGVDSGRSQVLVIGEGFLIDSEQEEIVKEEQEEKDKEDKPDPHAGSDAWNAAAPEDNGKGDGKGEDNGAGNGGTKDDTPEETKPDENDPEPTPTPEPGPDEDQGLPIIESDLVNGQTYSGTYLGFYVLASESSGAPIEYRYVTVTVNNARVSGSSDDGYTSNYGVELVEGSNTVSITAKGANGKTATKQYSINCDAGGSVTTDEYLTFTVRADNVGIGYITGGTIELQPNEMLDHALKRGLQDAGLSPGFNGGYLSYIGGIDTSGCLDYVTSTKGTPENEGNTHGSYVLGERDYFNGSGWMYDLNGETASTGLSSKVARDGDEVVLWFTLDLGNDHF